MLKHGKKTLLLLFFIIFTLAGFLSDISAKDMSDEAVKNIQEQMQENIDEQLKGIDTSIFDNFIFSLDSDSYKVFGNISFMDKLRQVISGETAVDYNNLFEVLTEVFLGDSAGLLPIIAIICSIAIVASLLTFAKSENSKSGEIVHFVCYISIVLIVLNVIFQLIKVLSSALNAITGFMSLIFPVILTLMTASGSAVSSKIYQPAVALLCSSASNIFTVVIIPLFIASIVLNVVSNLSDNVRVSKFADFFKSSGQWITGIVFTVFMAFLSIQGISAATYDSVSIRAVKYAIGNSIPLVGGYIKEGFDLILGSTILIKNAVGITGLIMLLAFMIAPIINIIVCNLGFKLASAIVQPLSDGKIPNFLQSVSKSLNLLMAAFTSVAFMFFITVMLMIMTTNSVFV